jgi:DnaJ family protein C protein 7
VLTFLLFCSAILRKDGNNVHGMRAMATLYYYENKFPNAIKYLQVATNLDPDNKKCVALFKLIKKADRLKSQGNDAFKAGDAKGACDAYTQAINLDPKNKAFNCVLLCNRAAALMKLKKFEEAVEDCDAALEIDEEYRKAILRRAECRMQTEDYEGAVRDFERAYQMEADHDLRDRIREAKVRLKQSKKKDYYKILGVDRDASERDIKKAYRSLALQYHPDKVQGTEKERAAAETKFKLIGEAYQILSDPEKKARYDAGADIDGEYAGDGMNGGHGGMNGMDMNDIFQMFMHQQGGGGRGGHGGHGGHSHGFGGAGGNPFGGSGFQFHFG